MKYQKTVTLKNKIPCLIRSGEPSDGAAVLDQFNRTHAETDFLLTYPDENSFTVESETEFLTEKLESPHAVELLALIDDQVVGTAGFDAIMRKDKTRHRAEFGISVLKDFWGSGIGGALTEACIECAKTAGYEQLELDVVATNTNAIGLYQKYGFEEYGRNPRGFKSRTNEYQELVYMRKELE